MIHDLWQMPDILKVETLTGISLTCASRIQNSHAPLSGFSLWRRINHDEPLEFSPSSGLCQHLSPPERPGLLKLFTRSSDRTDLSETQPILVFPAH